VEVRQRSPHRAGAGHSRIFFNIGARAARAPQAQQGCMPVSADPRPARPALERLALGVPSSAWRVVGLAALLLAVRDAPARASRRRAGRRMRPPHAPPEPVDQGGMACWEGQLRA